MMQDWRETLAVPVEIRADNRFLCPREDFAQWAEGRHHLRMETFYRGMRRRTGLLDGRRRARGRPLELRSREPQAPRPGGIVRPTGSASSPIP
ncbi:cryptochrome/photolyase family protein [Methylobacterium oryzae CBMB20]